MIFPTVLLGLVVIMISAAYYFYGSNAAITIAQTGASAAAAEHGSVPACTQAARGMADRVGDALRNVTVACARSATTVRVTVTGKPLSLVPDWSPTVSHTATIDVERVTGP